MTFGPLRFAPHLFAAVLAALLVAPQVHAHDDHGHAQGKPDPKAAAGAFQPDAHTRADIERHRAMAKAHDAAAQCLASAGEHEKCEKQLQADCKGLALGKYCGMRHAH